MYINKCRIILILIKIIYLNWLEYQTFIFCSAKTELFAANQNDRKICIWSWKPNRGPWRTTEDGCGCASSGELHQGISPGPVWTPPDYLLRTGKDPCQIIKNCCHAFLRTALWFFISTNYCYFSIITYYVLGDTSFNT